MTKNNDEVRTYHNIIDGGSSCRDTAWRKTISDLFEDGDKIEDAIIICVHKDGGKDPDDHNKTLKTITLPINTKTMPLEVLDTCMKYLPSVLYTKICGDVSSDNLDDEYMTMVAKAMLLLYQHSMDGMDADILFNGKSQEIKDKWSKALNKAKRDMMKNILSKVNGVSE